MFINYKYSYQLLELIMTKNKLYIVEAGNWRCSIDLKDDPIYTEENECLMEAVTQVFEVLFSYTSKQDEYIETNDNVELMNLTDGNVDFVTTTEVTHLEDIPSPIFTLLTKVFNADDMHKPENHFYIKTEAIIQNASLTGLQPNFYEFKNDEYKTKPDLKKLLEVKLKSMTIFKCEDTE